MPEIIKGGHLFIAQPPLYKVAKGRSEVYLKDGPALDRYLVEAGLSGRVLETAGGARGGAGGHAGRAGGREFTAQRARGACAAHAARPAPRAAPHLTLGVRLSRHPDRTSCSCGAGGPLLCCELISRPKVLAIDGSRTPARDRRRGGLGTFACAAAFDRSAASAAPARARRRRIQPFAGAATAFDGARTSPVELPA